MIALTISGRVGKDAEVKETYAVFTVASTKKGYTKKDGVVVEDQTTWISVFCNPNLGKHIKKGQYVTIYTDGLNLKGYTDKQGNPQASTSIYAVSLEFGGEPKQSGQVQAQAPAPTPNYPPQGMEEPSF